jgi:hypothetical protein
VINNTVIRSYSLDFGTLIHRPVIVVMFLWDPTEKASPFPPQKTQTSPVSETFSSYSEFRTMNRVRTPSVVRTSSSERFRIYYNAFLF